MRGITSGLEPRRYAEGDLVEEESGMFDGMMDFFKEYGPMASLPMAAYEYATDPEKAKERYTKEGLMERHDIFKENIFDYEDPMEYATLPLYFAGPTGIAANRAIKAGRIANKTAKAGKAYKPGGLENILGSKAVSMGVPAATLATEVGYSLATDPEMKDIFSNDAVDDAQEDLETVTNDQKEKEEKEKEDASLTDEEKFMNGLGALFQSFGASQGVGDAPTGIKGGMIKGTAINTPEITRYQGGGIADMMPQEPMMMADGGIAHFAKGKEVVVKKIIKQTAKQIKAAKDKAAKTKATKEANKAAKEAQEAASKTKALEVAKETASMPVRPDPKYLDFIAKASPGSAAAILASSKAAIKAGKGIKRNIKPILGSAAVASVPVGIAGGLYSAFSGDENPVVPPKDSTIAAEVKLPDDSLRDILYNKSLARAQAAGREDPSFIDYVASFPGGFSEKSNKDPEFQRQMMAGFLAMMKPTEGFVPRNAFVDFGEAAMAEGARQEGEIPDQLKLMERFKDDPELLDSYRKYSRSLKPLSAVDKELEMMAVERNIRKLVYGDKAKDSKKIYDKPAEGETLGMPIPSSKLYQMYLDADENYETVRAQVTGDGS